MSVKTVAVNLLLLIATTVFVNGQLRYEHGIQAQEQHCDTEIHLRLNQSYVVRSFPPEPLRLTGYYGQRNGFYGSGPRECTLSFKAVGNCMLTWRTTHYETRLVDCIEEYLLIGDENKEKRICGFDRPVRHFNSSGKFLFMTHYQRVGYGESIVSNLGGVVRCEKKEPSCSPSWSAFRCFVLNGGICGPCFGNVSVTTNTTTPVSDSVSDGCADCSSVLIWGCLAGTNETTCDAPPPPPTLNESPKGPVGDCHSAQAACPVDDPKCTINVSYTANNFTISPSFLCLFPPNSRCALAMVLCFKTA